MSDESLLSGETWAVVEVMGHNTFAGRVSEHVLGGTTFIRVDVPPLAEKKWTQYGQEYTEPPIPAFTKLIGAGSIYAITPCSEEIARKMAEKNRTRPVAVLDLETRSERIAIEGPVRSVGRDLVNADVEDEY